MSGWQKALGVCSLVGLLINPCRAAFYPGSDPAQVLRILSSTDEQVMQPLLNDFQQLHPEVSIDYQEANSLPLFHQFQLDYAQGQTADIIISSAMDLQIRLVNDGYAATHQSAASQWLPDWAQWRRQAFGFTYEPAVMVYNQRLLAGTQVAGNRFQWLNVLKSAEAKFQGRVGTYDIAKSGLGYLFASQDAQQASTWGRLLESLRGVDVRLFESSSEMLATVQSGELLMAYNVLGSYVRAQASQYPDVREILPTDYTLVMSRIAFVSRRAQTPALGHRFLDYLLGMRGQTLLSAAHLFPIHPDIRHHSSFQGLHRALQGIGPLKLIKLSPALLTYQDRMKKQRFLEEWSVLRQ